MNRARWDSASTAMGQAACQRSSREPRSTLRSQRRRDSDCAVTPIQGEAPAWHRHYGLRWQSAAMTLLSHAPGILEPSRKWRLRRLRRRTAMSCVKCGGAPPLSHGTTASHPRRSLEIISRPHARKRRTGGALQELPPVPHLEAASPLGDATPPDSPTAIKP